MRQQLREWCYEAPAKRGSQRQALAVEACFAPLLRWVLLAGGPTGAGARSWATALPCWRSACSTGAVIPVAAILPATAKGAWKPEWRRLLPPAGHGASDHDRHRLGPGAVCPLAVSGHCPPGVAPPAAGQRRRPVSAPGPGALAAGQLCPRAGHPVATPGHGVQDPPAGLYLVSLLGTGAGGALVAGDRLAPGGQHGAWYGLRAWIEQGFKLTKRGGWQWQRTRMNPARAARLWLVVAVATLWLVSVGGVAEDASSAVRCSM